MKINIGKLLCKLGFHKWRYEDYSKVCMREGCVTYEDSTRWRRKKGWDYI